MFAVLTWFVYLWLLWWLWLRVFFCFVCLVFCWFCLFCCACTCVWELFVNIVLLILKFLLLDLLLILFGFVVGLLLFGVCGYLLLVFTVFVMLCVCGCSCLLFVWWLLVSCWFGVGVSVCWFPWLFWGVCDWFIAFNLAAWLYGDLTRRLILFWLCLVVGLLGYFVYLVFIQLLRFSCFVLFGFGVLLLAFTFGLFGFVCLYLLFACGCFWFCDGLVCLLFINCCFG